MPPVLIVLIVLILVAAALILVWRIPAFRHEEKKQTEKEIATEEVESIIRRESLTPAQIEERNARYRSRLEAREKDLGFCFTDEDIESMMPQMAQDEKDDKHFAA